VSTTSIVATDRIGCAPSMTLGLTGVVRMRRSTPFSRYVANSCASALSANRAMPIATMIGA
jgi:hypothetical protein